MNDRFIKSGDACGRLGVSAHTLRRWDGAGAIACVRSPGGHRLYNVDGFVAHRGGADSSTASNAAAPGISYCYCRVSSASQKDDLQRQIAYMQERFPGHTIVSDVASGINFRRRGLRTILDNIFKGNVQQVVVAYRDRLARFAFELLQWIFQTHGVELLVLDPGVVSVEQELSADLLSIIQVFSCRVKGRRKYQKRSVAEAGSGEQREEDLPNAYRGGN